MSSEEPLLQEIRREETSQNNENEPVSEIDDLVEDSSSTRAWQTVRESLRSSSLPTRLPKTSQKATQELWKNASIIAAARARLQVDQTGDAPAREGEADVYEKAAALVDTALHGDVSTDFLDAKVLVQSAHARFYYKMYKSMNIPRLLLLTALVVCPFFEVPPWCQDGSLFSPSSPCGHDHPLSRLVYVPEIYMIAAQLVLVLCFMFDTFCQVQFSSIPTACGFPVLWRIRCGHPFHRLILVKMVVLAAYLADLVVTLVLPRSHVSLAGYIRILLLVCCSGRTRSNFHSMFSILPRVWSILFLLGVYILFSSWLMQVLFQNTKEGQEAFKDFYDAVYSLVVLITTANNPGVWDTVYHQYRFSCVLFIGYLSFGLLLLLNILTAVVYEAYKTREAMQLEREETNHHICLHRAFHLLARLNQLDQDAVGKEELQQLLDSMRSYMTVPQFSQSEFEALFQALDKDGDQSISIDEFKQLAAVIRTSSHHRDNSLITRVLRRLFPGAPPDSVFRKTILSSQFEWTVNIILILSMATIFFETQVEIISDYLVYLQITMLVFGFLYFVEMMLMILASGWEDYWHFAQNRFDFIVTWVVTIMQIVLIYPNQINNFELIRYVQLFRILRLVRLFEYVPRYRVIICTASVVIPSLAQLIFSLFCILSVFCICGVQLFGGLVKNKGLNHQIQELTYTTSSYEDYNFNDFGSGLVILFNVLILNDWCAYMDAYSTLTGTRLARLFFMVFWVVAVIFVLNLVVAIILDAFIKEMELVSELERTTSEGVRQKRKHASAVQPSLTHFDILKTTIFAASLESPSQVNLGVGNHDSG